MRPNRWTLNGFLRYMVPSMTFILILNIGWSHASDGELLKTALIIIAAANILIFRTLPDTREADGTRTPWWKRSLDDPPRVSD